jgi:hypothetical protein
VHEPSAGAGVSAALLLSLQQQEQTLFVPQQAHGLSLGAASAVSRNNVPLANIIRKLSVSSFFMDVVFAYPLWCRALGIDRTRF